MGSMGGMGGMGMGGMSGMGGMDMSSEGLFTAMNKSIAHRYWHGIAGVIGILTIARIASFLQSKWRRRQHKRNPQSISSRPRGWLTQCYATATATFREALYPQPVYFTGRISKFFSPMPLGKWLLLAVYWTAILIMLWSNVILYPDDPMYGYRWEKVGFRAAWVSVTQIPFIYLLSCKFSVVTMMTGISYERINWFHRWAARTVFLTVIVHWSFFYREWDLAKFVKFEFEMMPMVKYGFGAWATVGWMVLSGFGFFRALNYELFVAQHICAAAAFLWLLYMHVPRYATYNIWMAVGFVAFDWGCRIVWNLLRNLHVLTKGGPKAPGYLARLETVPGDLVRLTIDHVDFSWRAGQHAFLSVPSVRPFEVHPFTIANSSHSTTAESERRLTMVIKARSGFSRSLYKAALKDEGTNRQRRAFISGPFGNAPDLLQYETVVLIACSTGASFTIPLLQDCIQRQGCVRRVIFHWIVRSYDHVSWCDNALMHALEVARVNKLGVKIVLHVTMHLTAEMRKPARSSDVETVTPMAPAEELSALESKSVSSFGDEKTPLSTHVACQEAAPQPDQSISICVASRPTVEAMIRPPVEAALGETAVVVCGGLSITAQARTFVAALSNERAVHKGTGAQGIFLWTETYGW